MIPFKVFRVREVRPRSAGGTPPAPPACTGNEQIALNAKPMMSEVMSITAPTRSFVTVGAKLIESRVMSSTASINDVYKPPSRLTRLQPLPGAHGAHEDGNILQDAHDHSDDDARDDRDGFANRVHHQLEDRYDDLDDDDHECGHGAAEPVERPWPRLANPLRLLLKARATDCSACS